MNAGVVLRGVDVAETEPFSSGRVSVSGVRRPVQFDGPATPGADELERGADVSSEVASGSASGSASTSASEASSSSSGRTAYTPRRVRRSLTLTLAEREGESSLSVVQSDSSSLSEDEPSGAEPESETSSSLCGA